ncbi:hypothetical protein [Xanthomonas translucens]|uniref:hypothetical protein n=1 Tax=Xanthomonas campestris pv. translucens TaxID=343 RepID=UPI003CE4E8C3
MPAFSAGSFSDLLRQVDSSLFDASFFDSMPAFGAHHAQAATGELDEVQSALRAADDPQPPVRVAVTVTPRGRRAPSRPSGHGVLRKPPMLRLPRMWI